MMKSLYFDEELEIRQVPQPGPGEGEALIRVKAAGICRTDLEIVQGYMGFKGILGHEFHGAVEQCASAPQWQGKRVCGEINLAPWTDDSVQQRHDPSRTVLGILGKDGCFAEYVTLPVKNLVEIPDSIDDDAATFVEPLAAAFEILEQIQVRPADRVAVLGDGKLGLLCAQVLMLVAGHTTLIGKHEQKLKIARAWNIATAHIDEGGSLERSFDIVVDATGRPQGLTSAISLLKPRGTLVLKTTTAVPPGFNTAQLVIDEITVVGSRCGQFEPAVAALASKRIDVTPLIEATYSLDDGLKAFDHAGRPGALKILLKP